LFTAWAYANNSACLKDLADVALSDVALRAAMAVLLRTHTASSVSFVCQAYLRAFQ